MINALIIDDEAKSRETLEGLLKRYCKNVAVVGMADSVDTGLNAITTYQPDLVFLDIEMPFGTGFDLLEKVQSTDFDVIFTTAYNQYAIKAIKFSALDYLLKPIDVEELIEAVGKLEKKRAKNISTKNNLENLISNLKHNNKPKKIGIPNSEGLVFIGLDEIVRCMADTNYTIIILTNGSKIIVSRTLKEYEEMLTDENFIRVHHSHLVNILHVKKYIKGEGGYVVMSDGTTVEVSRRKKAEVLEKLSAI